MDKGTLVIISFFLLICVVVYGGSMMLSNAECNAKTRDIGFDHRWSLMAGCQIEVKPNQWIPLDSFYYQERP